MGILHTLKLFFKPEDDLTKLASSPNTPSDTLAELYWIGSSKVKEALATNPKAPEKVLVRLCKEGDNRVREAVASNPKTPNEILVEELIKAITAKEGDVRKSATRAIGRIPKRAKRRYEALRLELALKLTGLLITCDWYRSIDIVQALGIVGNRAATDTICSLIDNALVGFNTYADRSTSFEFENERVTMKSLLMTTDTKDTPISPDMVYYRFITNAVQALGNIGDPDAEDTLKSISKIKSYTYGSTLKSTAKAVLNKIQKGEKAK